MKAILWVLLGIAIGGVIGFAFLFKQLHDAEEVVVLHADAEDLPLWIVERDGEAWLGMAREKALTHNLDGRQFQLSRFGSKQCVIPVLHDDLNMAKMVHSLKLEKYAGARVMVGLGIYPSEASSSSVALRVDPCS
ncbi:MAG: hypothetical protein AAGE43_05845 [Pseudomonadota bacterium]